MEKLQAALARAREKRDNDGLSLRPEAPESKERPKSRRSLQKQQAVNERWEALPLVETSPKHLLASRVYANKASSEAQHFDILRTKLFLEMRRNDWTRIAVTSATPSCGKTTTVCNLIAGLGRQPENRGMLFDLDFRRPSVSKLFGIKPKNSLEDVLMGEVDFADHAVRAHPNTCLAMTTRSVPDPARVILRSQTSDLLDQIQVEYRPDIMLFDLPPALVSDETRGFLKKVDAVLIVAGAETSTVAQVDEVEREVAQYANVAGIVLNKCRFMEQGYGYTY